MSSIPLRTHPGISYRLLALTFVMVTASPAGAWAQAATARTGETDQCAQYSRTSPPAQPVRIRYGLTGGGEEPLALLWADKDGYPNHGKFYTLEPKLYAANDRMTAVQAGQLDAGSISLPTLVTAVRVGIDLRAVASVVETNAKDNQGAFVVLKDSGIQKVEQLKGKRIGYYGPNTVSEYWIKSALKKAGLKPNDVRYVSMPPPAQEQALRNEQLDVAWLPRQFLARAEKAGGVDILMRPMQATAQAHPSTLVFFTQKFVKTNPAAYCAWRKDYEAAVARWSAERVNLYPKLIAASYVTPMAANAGPDGGRSDGGKISLSDVDRTIADMVDSDFLAMARGMKADQLVLKGFALQH